ncbi:MAG: hypothetical protein KDB61_05240 [Planctomycetes bacterium]|nr:hypothetical protein [Planctomycetota bacterium]
MPTIVTLLGFAGCIVLGVTWLGGDTVYRIDDEGLERVVTSLLTRRAHGRRFGWEMVDSYKAGRDLDRAWVEYDFLEIGIRQRGHRW